MLLGLGVSTGNQTENGIRIARAFAVIVIGITVARLGETLFGTDLTSWITPFHQKVLLDQQAGGHNSMGGNTALRLLLIAISRVLHSVQMPTLSQLTATTGIGLAIAALALTANHGGLRAVLNPYIGGKIARAQALAGYVLPTALGYLLVKSVATGTVQSYGLFGIFVVTICWGILLMGSMKSNG